MKRIWLARAAEILVLIACAMASHVAAQSYDLVVKGGRVVDPETHLEAVRNVGIKGHTIVIVTDKQIVGKKVIDATGLIVAPGFIDLHQHGQTAEAYRLKAFDGVTTALEMEIGVHDIRTYLAERSKGALINYGATASWNIARAGATGVKVADDALVPASGAATNDAATPEQLAKIKARLQSEIDGGALGVGLGIQYVPGAKESEVLEMFRLAAANHLPVYTHMRSAGETSVNALREVIGDAAITGAALQVVHVNSTCLHESFECLEMIKGAREHGVDVTTEAYPYTAGLTPINSALFNPGWREQLGISYDSLVIPETGEHLTQERFEQMHADAKPEVVLVYINPDELVDRVILDPGVMIASDGFAGHPRQAGCFARVLARYVREQRSLTLMEAIRKMSLMPAERLAASTAAGKLKGRIQVGADADVVVFDLKRIQDEATYAEPLKVSEGVKYLIVGGEAVIADGKLQEGVLPGRAVLHSFTETQTR